MNNSQRHSDRQLGKFPAIDSKTGPTATHAKRFTPRISHAYNAIESWHLSTHLEMLAYNQGSNLDIVTVKIYDHMHTFSHLKLNRFFSFTQLILLIPLALLTTGCSEYWWSRGQPPRPQDLITRSVHTFREVQARRHNARPVFLAKAEALERNLLEAVVALKRPSATGDQGDLRLSIAKVQDSFAELEGSLSFPSRPAYGELMRQSLAYLDKIKGGEVPYPPTFEMFAARTINFLAREMESDPVA